MFRGMAFTTVQKSLVYPMSATLNENIITEMSKQDFGQALMENRGALIIKFGAEWCGPCKRIDPLVYSWMNRLPETIQGAVIDIDDEASFDLYAFLKSKKQVNGVPVILCYKKGNMTYVPDNVIVGADEDQVNRFFTACMAYA
jgi:hypothetical protein